MDTSDLDTEIGVVPVMDYIELEEYFQQILNKIYDSSIDEALCCEIRRSEGEMEAFLCKDIFEIGEEKFVSYVEDEIKKAPEEFGNLDKVMVWIAKQMAANFDHLLRTEKYFEHRKTKGSKVFSDVQAKYGRSKFMHIQDKFLFFTEEDMDVEDPVLELLKFICAFFRKDPEMLIRFNVFMPSYYHIDVVDSQLKIKYPYWLPEKEEAIRALTEAFNGAKPAANRC